MSSESDSTNRKFLDVAVAHGLLDADDAEVIRDHAIEQQMQPSDAALSLSMMKPWQVEAALLLADPSGFAPGFQLTGLIGAGAAGLVFRAHQRTLGRDVALKTINIMSQSGGSKGESRIQREAQAIARLQHPNIVAAYDSGFHHGRFWISMEFIQGETLSDLIDRESSVSESMVLSVVRQAASALDHARQIGIIHRDVKPANLLLCDPPAGTILPDGVPFVKVADFGLALDAMHDGDNKLTATGATLGTPAYIAPEQLQNTRVDCRADIYSLGTTVYHMLAGEIPWAGRSPMKAILDKTVGDDRWREGFPTSASAFMTSLFRDMTAADPDDRIPDYATLIDRIDQHLDGRGRQEAVIDSTVKALKDIKQLWPRRPVRVASFVGLMLCLVTFVAWIAGDLTKPDVPNEGVPWPSKDIPWKPVGLRNPLFNGMSAPLKHVMSVGTWTPQKASDGSGVLVGGEGSSLSIPLKTTDGKSNDVALRLSVHVPAESTVAELFVEKVTKGPGLEGLDVLHAVTISDDSAQLFDGGDMSLPPTASQSLSSSDPGDVQFRRIQVRRAGDSLTLILNGHPLVQTSCDRNGEYNFRIRCDRGAVSLADISIVELVQDTATSE